MESENVEGKMKAKFLYPSPEIKIECEKVGET